jgi:preprotein translocase subunit SecG
VANISWPTSGKGSKSAAQAEGSWAVMERIILVIHLMIAAALVAVVLMQKSEGGALGIGGGGMSNFMTGRGTASILTRATAVLAACFMLTSLVLVILPQLGTKRASILPADVTTQAPASPTAPAGSTLPAPATQPATPPKPTTPSVPSVPLGQ